MWKDIITAQARLELVDVPKSVKNRRFTVLKILGDSAGLAFGTVAMVAAQLGPVKFLLSIFRKKLIEDPDAPFVYFLLRIANTVSAKILFYLGLGIIILNLIFLTATLSRFFWLKKDKNFSTKKISTRYFG